MPPVEALRELAGRVALQLVAQALQGLVGNAPAMLTLEPSRPAPQTLALPPARRGRKPGPKPKRGKTARVVRPRKFAPPAPERSSLALETLPRRCRKCKRLGPCARVAGTARTVRCGFCGFKWDARAKADETGSASPATCTKCDHAATQHEDERGRCLVPRCACSEFYA